MTDTLSIALAQIDPKVGDLQGNRDKILRARAEAAAGGADLVLFGELVVSGYPPEDLVLKRAFLDAVRGVVEELARATDDGGPALLVTTPWMAEMPVPDGGEGYEVARRPDPDSRARHCFNAVLLLDEGEIKTARFKHVLPNYGVFDEVRVFQPGPLPGPINFHGVRIGIPICEDLWTPDCAECLAESGAEILLCPNGSPYESKKNDIRLNLIIARINETGLPIAYLNQVGGQDELVFDGASFVLNADKSLAWQLPAWRECVAVTRWQRDGDGWHCVRGEVHPVPEGEAAIYGAMVLGLRDYVEKNGFPGVILGLSGGIDSALSAAVAVDALGAARVRCVMMPSPYTSRESLEDAAAVAQALGVRLDDVSIEPAMHAFDAMLGQLFNDLPPGVTEENIQSRARGITLMALSNKFGNMVLSTGNKSEMSVGYATIYGDMCGGYSVLKDVYKTAVFGCARWRNANRPEGALGPAGVVIPARVIDKPPSAELRPDQKDEDSLPPYATLDAILHGLIEEDLGAEEVVARGHDRATVTRVWRLLENAEYKRRQAPPGVKITRRTLSRDRRYPITNGYKGSG